MSGLKVRCIVCGEHYWTGTDWNFFRLEDHRPGDKIPDIVFACSSCVPYARKPKVVKCSICKEDFVLHLEPEESKEGRVCGDCRRLKNHKEMHERMDEI